MFVLGEPEASLSGRRSPTYTCVDGGFALYHLLAFSLDTTSVPAHSPSINPLLPLQVQELQAQLSALQESVASRAPVENVRSPLADETPEAPVNRGGTCAKPQQASQPPPANDDHQTLLDADDDDVVEVMATPDRKRRRPRPPRHEPDACRPEVVDLT
eukprot:8422206-Pyramimonas_sp.AAC.1